MNVTAWERWTPPPKKNPEATGSWSHNHIEDGYATGEKPADPFNRGWDTATWRKRHTALGPPGKFGAPVVLTAT